MSSPVYIVQGSNAAMAQEFIAQNPNARFLLLSENPIEKPPSGEYISCVGSALDEEFLRSSLEQALERWQNIDGYAHFSGSILLKPLHMTRIEEWEGIFSKHVTTAFVGLKVLLPIFKRQGHGSVVLISSTAARVGLQNHEAIAAAKGALEALVRSCAATYAPVRFNAIAPGLTRSRMSQKIVGSEPALKASLQLQAIARLAEPSDMASAVTFLIGSQSGMITGQVIAIDGGLSSTKRMGL
ncbi:MAG: SDR family oxidoreductase [Betaproteobacteria bacterium]|nr:SDR family oxidoreductase [Betaproteobacteria bacterium]